VRKNLETGSVDTLLLSSRLRKSRVKIRCANCPYHREITVAKSPGNEPVVLEVGGCPSCSAPLVKDEVDLIEDLTHLAVKSGSTTEFITDDFEEGAILFNAFGGVAAILRFRTGY
jgi:peptide chain release factor subunit 1